MFLLSYLLQLVQQPKKDTSVHGGSVNYFCTVARDAVKVYPGFNQCVSSFEKLSSPQKCDSVLNEVF